ncbi:MAG TPA: hypothetical protein VFU69_00340, partial [Ktedonobacterales bacterium]|nr:hypothetical protein [Ktedonobacterales bacterium]
MRLWHRQRGETSPQRRLRLGTGSFWLESVALPLGLLALQALPLGALLQLGAAWVTNDANQPLLPTWALLLLLAEAFYLARWLTQHPTLKGWTPLFIAIGALVTLLIVWYARIYAGSGPIWQEAWLIAVFHDFQALGARIAAPVGAIALLALLWWRGLQLG